MTMRRNQEDLLNPGRVFHRLINDYSNGRLTKSWLKLFRARIERVDPIGGALENPPANPPNSIRARVYSNGLDVNIPSEALSVFHPLLPGHLSPPVSEGEHVYVVFEDEAMSHGLWIAPISSYHNLNFSDPDARETEQRDVSSAMEGDSGRQTIRTPSAFNYGGLSVETRGNQRSVDRFERTSRNNIWRAKQVLMIGDSQVSVGPLNRVFGQKIRELGADSYTPVGRGSWRVVDWLNNFHPRLGRPSSPNGTFPELITQTNPDIIVILLGGNDGSSDHARRSEYEQEVRRLWNQASSVPLRIWVGPPTAVGNGARGQPGRSIASEKILSVVGAANFVDSRSITNITEGRDRMGVHFTPNSPAINPWADLIIEKGNQLSI